MKLRALIAAFLFVFGFAVFGHSQEVDVSQFPGVSLDVKLTNAMSTGCSADVNVHCILVIRPEMSVFGYGAMFSLPVTVCTHCLVIDYANVGSFGSFVMYGPGAMSGATQLTFNAATHSFASGTQVLQIDPAIGPLAASLASSGFVRLNLAGTICWRNNANNGNNCIQGYQNERTAGCATAAAAGATCDTTVTWTSAFASSTYNVVCNGKGITSGQPINGGVVNQNTTDVSFRTVAFSAVAAQYTSIHCYASTD